MGFIERYMLQLNTEKRRWRRAVSILAALSLIVALVTVWNLRMTGVTIANGAACGREEHQHSAECATQETLVCGTYSTESATEETSAHVHSDECFGIVYLCGREEHIHTISCYSDPAADVETEKDWEATLPVDLGRYWSENMARIALSQIGVSESQRNYILAADGETKQGITRYGQWYGNPYGD